MVMGDDDIRYCIVCMMIFDVCLLVWGWLTVTLLKVKTSYIRPTILITIPSKYIVARSVVYR